MKNSAESEERLKQIEELSDFIDRKEKSLFEITDKVGWTQETIMGKKDNVQCPYDPSHWVAVSSLEKHCTMCALVHKGYSKAELEKEPPSSSFFYEKSTSIAPIHIDKNELNVIISEANAKDGKQLNSSIGGRELPETTNRYISDFSPVERLAVYNYVVEKGKAAKKVANVSMQELMVDFENTSSQNEKPKTFLEILAEKRDYKRRRQSYRAKNVHVTKKSYTEVMKEVIGNQMQYLVETQKEEQESEIDERLKDHESSRNMDESEQITKNEVSSEDSRRKRAKKHHHHKRNRSRSRHREKHKKHKRHSS